MTKIEVELEPEELADLEEFVKRHPRQFRTPSDALKQMAGLKMYRKMKQTVDPERKKAPILGCEVGIPTFYPCALNEMLDARKMTYQDFIDESIIAGLQLVQVALDKGTYKIENGQVIIPDESQESVKWFEEHPGVMLVAEVGEVKVKGEAK
jgi:hypothetical protein